MKSPRITPILFLNVIGAFVVVYLVVVLAQTVKHNYDLSRQIDVMKAQMVLLQDQKDQLSYNIQYYQTDSYKDREARAKLGLQAPGENVIILPSASPSPTPTAATPATKAKAKSNLQQWIDFITGNS